jgi:endonuclease YncB( thermonuclease family)
VMTVPPNVRYQELFVTLQRDARNAHRGLWLGVGRVWTSRQLDLVEKSLPVATDPDCRTRRF